MQHAACMQAYEVWCQQVANGVFLSFESRFLKNIYFKSYGIICLPRRSLALFDRSLHSKRALQYVLIMKSMSAGDRDQLPGARLQSVPLVQVHAVAIYY